MYRSLRYTLLLGYIMFCFITFKAGHSVLKWILNKHRVIIWTGLICSGQRPVAGFCEEGNEPRVPQTVGDLFTS